MQTDSQDCFALFGLPPRFAIDLGQLDMAFRRLQSELHPDRHVRHDEMERRIALQLSTRVNDAYQTLRKPASRAQCLIDMAEEKTCNTLSHRFLMLQMEWREEIECASNKGDHVALVKLAHRLQNEMREHERKLADALDMRSDFQNAALLVNELRFYERLRIEINDALDQLEN